MAEVPGNWRDNEGWESYWRQRAAESPDWSDIAHDQIGRGQGVSLLRELLSERHDRVAQGEARSRILFAGNGNCPEPMLYAHWGHECVALDASPTACAQLESSRDRRDILERFYCTYRDCHRLAVRPRDTHPTTFPDLDTARARLAAEHDPGGSVDILLGDMFEYQPENRYDAIISRFCFQRFGAAERDELAQRFARWIRPGGLLLIEGRWASGDWAGYEERHLMHSHLRGAGFLIHREEIDRLDREYSHRAHRESRLDPVTGQRRITTPRDWLHRERVQADECERERAFRAAGGLLAVVELRSG